MSISAQDVNKLRQATGAGMMDCKKALTEANGDFEAAVDILRKKGQKISANRADRDAAEGCVFVRSNNDDTIAYLVALNCETDFVAKNSDFIAIGNKIVEVASNSGVDSADALLSQSLEDGRAISEHLTDMMGKIGEKIEVSSYIKMSGDQVVGYVHSNGKLGVLVELQGAKGDGVIAAGKDVAMQIAAMNPISVSKNEVPQEVIDRELAVGREQALAEGKPENIVDKIAEGKLNKFFKDSTLLSQDFVKDNSKTIEKMLKEVDSQLTVSSFKRVAIG